MHSPTHQAIAAVLLVKKAHCILVVDSAQMSCKVMETQNSPSAQSVWLVVNHVVTWCIQQDRESHCMQGFHSNWQCNTGDREASLRDLKETRCDRGL